MAHHRLLTLVGLTTFWLCFSSLWAHRAGQRLDLPLNVFKDWAPTPERASDVGMIAIYVCWPFILATLYLLWRFAQSASAKCRWERLAAPFDAHRGLRSSEKSVYRLFFLLLFWAIPMIHVTHFGHLFFDRAADQVAVFQWRFHSWIRGTDVLYGGLTYFGWTPLLVIGALVAIVALNITLAHAIFRKPVTLT